MTRTELKIGDTVKIRLGFGRHLVVEIPEQGEIKLERIGNVSDNFKYTFASAKDLIKL